MSKTFKIDKDPCDLGYNIYEKSSITLNPGVTILVGCNGSGKTTLIKMIKEQLRKDNIEYVSFDNLTEGGSNAKSERVFHGDLQTLASLVCSSEGEAIITNIGTCARKIGNFVRNHRDLNEYWFFFDAIDSGTSIDNIIDIKKYLFDTILEDTKGKDTYIIVSANSYEMASGELCLDVISCSNKTFRSYNEYKDFILETKEKKNNRG